MTPASALPAPGTRCYTMLWKPISLPVGLAGWVRVCGYKYHKEIVFSSRRARQGLSNTEDHRLFAFWSSPPRRGCRCFTGLPRPTSPSAAAVGGLPRRCHLGLRTWPPPRRPTASKQATTNQWRATLHSGLGLGLSCKRLERLGMTKGA